MTYFRYHPEILSRFPDIVCGALVARDMNNCPPSEALQTLYQTEQQAALTKIGDTSLSELESLSAWRAAFRTFGVNPTKYRSAAEALLRRLTKKGDVPSINSIVDICNLVSIRYALPVAAFDTRHLSLPITVCFAEGHECFTPLFLEECEHPDPGEVIFNDENNLVVARRWCWRQSDESATRLETNAAIFTIEAHHRKGKTNIENALDDLQILLSHFIGGKIQASVLDANNPEF